MGGNACSKAMVRQPERPQNYLEGLLQYKLGSKPTVSDLVDLGGGPNIESFKKFSSNTGQ